MERSRVTRYIRVAVTALSLTACVLLIALWVRSHYFFDQVGVPFPGMRMFVVTSLPEHFEFWEWHDLDRTPRWEYRSFSDRELAEAGIELATPGLGLGFHASMGADNWGILLPYWFLVLLTSTLATLPWLHWRFSLRTLLIATTLIAVAMGAVIYLSG